VWVDMEATGYSRWFEWLLAELGFELWIGDPAKINAKRAKKQKFDREDARLLLRLMQAGGSSRGRDAEDQEQIRPLGGGEREACFKKDLIGPTLLEMSGSRRTRT